MTLLEVLANEKPKVSLSAEDKSAYVFGLRALDSVLSAVFFDIPRLEGDHIDHTGLFYSIPFVDDAFLSSRGSKRDLLLVFRLDTDSSFCPLAIDLDFTSTDKFEIRFRNQSESGVNTKVLLGFDNNDYYTDFVDLGSLTLSELLNTI
jgi:hypothetical protein